MCKKNELILALDIGKYETKAIGRKADGTVDDIKRVSFRTKSYDLDKGYIDLAGNSYKIQIDNKEYIIGEQGTEVSNDTSKTDLVHKLSAYCAISEYIQPETDTDIYLVLACPVSVLKQSQDKEEYKNYIGNNGEPIEIIVNDKKYKFTIKNTTIKAEGSGIIFTHFELFKDKTIPVIDFGGLNMGFSVYTNGVCKAEDRFTGNFGTQKLTIMIQDMLVSLSKGNEVAYYIAEKVLQLGYRTNLGEIDTESIEKVKEVKNKFLHDALKTIKARGYALNEFDGIVFVGGTTQKLKEQIKKIFPGAFIPENSQWSTVEGLYKIAIAKYLAINK